MTEKCLRCGIDFSKIKPIKRGWRPTRKGRTQKWQCSRCRTTFTKAGITFRMRSPRWKILKAIELRDNGLSYSQIAFTIGGVSRITVYKWCQARRKVKNKIIIIKRFTPGYYRSIHGTKRFIRSHYKNYTIKI